MVNINVVFDFRFKKLGDGGWVGGWWVVSGGWVVFTEIKDWFEPIKIYGFLHSSSFLKLHSKRWLTYIGILAREKDASCLSFLSLSRSI